MTELEEFKEELDRKGAVTLAVKVVPGSARTGLAGRMADGTLRVRVAAPAERGRANAELRSFLAAALKVPVSSVEIVSGAASTRKRLRITR